MTEPTIPDLDPQRIELLHMIAQNEPLGRTLNAVARMLSMLANGIRCAILLLKQERLTAVAHCGISREELQELCRVPASSVDAVTITTRLHCFELLPLKSPEGSLLGVLAFTCPGSLPGEPAIRNAVAALQSLTGLAIEHKKVMEELTFRAEHDPVTLLGNRIWFENRLQKALHDVVPGQTCVALLCVNLDRFRLINETLGHAVGDALLRQVAHRLEGYLYPGDSLARPGSDEFLLIIPSLYRAEDAVKRAERLHHGLYSPFYVRENELTLSASIGVAISSANITSTQFEMDAHAALKHAKRLGRNNVALFDVSLRAPSPERLEITQQLRSAIARKELSVHYQPQIDLATGKLTAVEALLRWRHPLLGIIAPSSFIPIAEESGLIGGLAQWVLTSAFQDYHGWLDRGLAPFRMAVNMSPLQFARKDFADIVIDQIHASGMHPENLELEITESGIMQDLSLAREHIGRLRALGVSFSLDDFGTGHSALAHLQSLSVQALKVDREFIRAIVDYAERPPLFERIVSLAHAIGVRTIVEGVETEAQAAAVTAMGCEEAQGFLYSKPLPAADLFLWASRRGGSNSAETSFL